MDTKHTLSKLVRFPRPSSIPKAMKQMTAATHIRHCSPPASCRANFTYSGVPLGGFSSLGPSLSKTWRAKVEVRPCGWRADEVRGDEYRNFVTSWAELMMKGLWLRRNGNKWLMWTYSRKNYQRMKIETCLTLVTLVVYLISRSSIVISWSSCRGRQITALVQNRPDFSRANSTRLFIHCWSLVTCWFKYDWAAAGVVD